MTMKLIQQIAKLSYLAGAEMTEESLQELLITPLLCHSERSEESLPESLVAHRDSSPLAGVQNDKIISLAGSQVCHSEGARSATEESLSESLVALFGVFERESLADKRDSSVVSLPQNDNSSRVSSDSICMC